MTDKEVKKLAEAIAEALHAKLFAEPEPPREAPDERTEVERTADAIRATGRELVAEDVVLLEMARRGRRSDDPADWTASEREERQQCIAYIRANDMTGLNYGPCEEVWERNRDLQAIRDAKRLPLAEQEGHPVLERHADILQNRYRRSH